eukprot:CAMPEP_0202821850 /NCGR_PEP_ID=MMETSP1389-20130828/10662_1 /ASSEMBLY_ACC=CAM_ASM_000865 /TAXON_ID=302021 /ORGANISM="Rhodomonas sp., Strain CCMP768" /LENGTH=78 /DNA_ID=CAMNT_0049494687 /DNA_START=61 /DNA_END=297 /DNA_ORIENTATION=-
MTWLGPSPCHSMRHISKCFLASPHIPSRYFSTAWAWRLRYVVEVRGRKASQKSKSSPYSSSAFSYSSLTVDASHEGTS